jgi:hypothetical protein
MPTNAPPLRALGDGRFELGSVRLSKRERTVTFPATATVFPSMALEYAVVHKTGKTHETLFVTATKAQDIHLAMLLLGARPAMTNAFPEDLAQPPPGDKVDVEVTWDIKGKKKKQMLEELILSRATGKALPRGPWYYNGSNFSEGMFTAQRDGSLISIHIDPDALINNPRAGRENDDLHIPNMKTVPPSGTQVEFTIRLLETTEKSRELRTPSSTK